MDVEELLSAAWLGATCICILALLSAGHFRSMILACCKRGKLSSSSSKFTVPQSYFTHFYTVAVVWNTLLLAAAFTTCCACTLMATSEGLQFSALMEQFAGASGSAGSSSITVMAKHRERGWTTVLLLLLMEVQIIRRLYECTVVFSYSPNARMHILGYLVGIFYYVAAPLSLCSSQDLHKMATNILALLGDGRLSHDPCVWTLDIEWWKCLKHLVGSLHWYHIVGGIVFFWGWWHQYKCHMILASLRSEDPEKKTTANQEYGIPYGDWFEKVSCAHYSAEIVMYVGLVLASGARHLPLWFLLSWVVSNLYLVARETHRWYLSTFEDYPKNRRPLVPSLW